MLIDFSMFIAKETKKKYELMEQRHRMRTTRARAPRI